MEPGFTFDVGPSQQLLQPAWDLAGISEQAAEDLRLGGKAAGTSVDDKIRRRLASNQAIKDRMASFKRKRSVMADSAGVEAESDEESDDEDVPLPGELDSDDEGDAEIGGASSEDDLLGGIGDAEDDDGYKSEDRSSQNSDFEAGVGTEDPTEGGLSGSDSEEEEDAPLENGRSSQSAIQHEGKAPTIDLKRGATTRKAGYFAATPEDTSFRVATFADLHLSRPLLKACASLGYTQPTPIQAACIPLALGGRDICGSAVTGSGKTAAFGLPLLERLLYRSRRTSAIYTLILAPTRELAVQVHAMLSKLAQFTDIRLALVVGGLSLQAQASTLRTNPEVVVATPGRLIDHLRNTQMVGLEDLQTLVLDEADRLLEMGFSEEIREIVKLAPRDRQTMLFSATMTEDVQKLVSVSLRAPVRLAADAAGQVPDGLLQEIIRLKGAGAAVDKEAMLLALCSKAYAGGRSIVFFRTKARAHRAKLMFGLASLGAAAELHGDMTQAARLASLEAFRKGDVSFLLATDVAARGLDILGVDAVINFDTPSALSGYLHRIGRTARAGKGGRSLTFIEDGDRALLKEVVKKTGAAMRNRIMAAPAVEVWRRRIEGLEREIIEVMREEREERSLRKAEQEATKAINMIEHQDEIYARPARTWFQTGKEKTALAERAKVASEAERGGSAKRPSMTKAERQAEKNRQKMSDRKNRERKNPLMEETKESQLGIRAIKMKEAQLRAEGMTASRAGKAAAAAVSGVKQKKKAKKQRLEATPEAAMAARLAAPSTVYGGGAKSGKNTPKPTMSKQEKNSLKRGGAGRHAFKSKTRHKRRH